MNTKRYSTEIIIIDSSPLRRYTKENERESSNLEEQLPPYNRIIQFINLNSKLIFDSFFPFIDFFIVWMR